MIEIYTLYPGRLNLNGDQANAFVLQKRLQWAGIEAQILPLESLDALRSFASSFAKDSAGKFLLVGHGSVAAMNSFISEHTEVRNIITGLIEAGLIGLAVGSGYELLAPDFNRVDRVSDYAAEESDGLPKLFGYKNTDTDLPVVQKLGESFVATFVHGPVLARTPELAQLFSVKLAAQLVTSSKADLADEIANQINAI